MRPQACKQLSVLNQEAPISALYGFHRVVLRQSLHQLQVHSSSHVPLQEKGCTATSDTCYGIPVERRSSKKLIYIYMYTCTYSLVHLFMCWLRYHFSIWLYLSVWLSVCLSLDVSVVIHPSTRIRKGTCSHELRATALCSRTGVCSPRIWRSRSSRGPGLFWLTEA